MQSYSDLLYSNDSSLSLGLMINMHLSANGFKNFMPSVVQTLGFSTTVSLVLTCPPYLLSAILSIIVSWTSGRYNERTWHITVSKSIAIVGFAIGWGTTNVAARYFAMCVFVGATYGVNNIGKLSSNPNEYLCVASELVEHIEVP